MKNKETKEETIKRLYNERMDINSLVGDFCTVIDIVYKLELDNKDEILRRVEDIKNNLVSQAKAILEIQMNLHKDINT